MRFVLILLVVTVTACGSTTEPEAQPNEEARAEAQQRPAATAPDREAILSTVDAFFLALGSADAEALERLYAPHVMTVIVAPDAEGEDRVRSRDPYGTLERMRAGDYPKIRERYWDPVVLQRGPFAVVWTPYSIDVDDARSHCGIDVFNLSKPEEAWRIDTILFTVEPNACDELQPSNTDDVRPDFSELDAAGQ